MKTRLLIALLPAALLSSSSAAQYENNIVYESDAVDSFADVVIEMPQSREINSGSKIIVDYEGEWPLSMKGAFEYAVKMWEENLPMTLPIRIKACIQPLRGGFDKLSTVTFPTKEYDGSSDINPYSFPLSAVKGTYLKEYTYNGRHDLFRGKEPESTLVDKTDMTITYNQNLLDQFSFNLDELAEDKYDFVTMALRDIAIGLGIGHQITADNASRVIKFPENRPTPYESRIMTALGTDPSVAYGLATQGSLSIGYELYAPPTFINGKSLQYFIPTGRDPLSNLLTYDFSKGYVMRDLTCDYGYGTRDYWNTFFTDYLKWDRLVITSTGNDQIEDESGTNNDTLPYKGSFTFNADDTYNTVLVVPADPEDEADHKSRAAYAQDCSVCRPYSIKYFPDNVTDMAPSYCLSVQLKDGKWEILTAGYFMGQSVTINPESYPLSLPEDRYARTISGGLKYRFVKQENVNMGFYQATKYQARYLTREYTPEVPEIEYGGVYETKDTRSRTVSADYDDYYVDVRINIANVEGADYIEVEQYDGDSDYPFYYDARISGKATSSPISTASSRRG